MSRFSPRPLFTLVAAVLLVGEVWGQPPAAQPAQPPAAQPAQPPAAQPPAQVPAAANPRYWTTEWSFQDIDVQQLFSRLQLIGVSIPVEAEGTISVNFTVSVPINRLRDGKAYRFRGRLSASQLRLEYLQLEDLDAAVLYSDGVMQLTNLSGRWIDARNVDPRQRLAAGAASQDSGGSFKGNARLELVPRGDLHANLTTDSLPFGPLHDLLRTATEQQDAKPIGGVVSGSMDFRAPLDHLTDLSRWTANADLKVDRFRFGDLLPLSATTGPLRIRDGIIDAPGIRITSPEASEIRLDLAARADLRRQQKFRFRVRGNDVPLGTVAALVMSDEAIASGKLDLDAEGSGELATRTWNVSGRIGSPGLSLLGQDLGLLEHRISFDANRLELTPLDPSAADEVDAMLLKQLQAEYQIDENKLEILDLSARVFGGTLEGNMTLARIDGIDHRFDMKWNDMRPEFSTASLFPVPVKISASTSGSIQWSVPAGSLDEPAAHRGVADFALSSITLGEANVGDINLRLSSSEGMFDVAGDGTLFGGTVSISTRSETEDGDSWQALLSRTPSGKATVQSMRLGLIVRAVQPRSQRRWSGRISATTDLTSGNLPWQPDVTLSAIDIAVDGRRLSRRISARLRLRDDVITIDRASGRYAGGQFWVEGRWAIGSDANRIQVRVSAVDASDALMTLSRKGAECADGKVSGWLTITTKDTIRIQGVITARNSSLFSVPTGSIHTGLNGSVALDLSRWKVTLPSIDGELAGGRIGGEAVLSSSSIRPGAFDLSSRWKANKVDFGGVIAAMSPRSNFAHGRITGNLTLGGKGIRSVNDLAGRFDARLEATQAAAIPGLLKADQYLGLISLSGVQFDEGYLKGLIAGGAAKIDELWLRSTRVRFWAEGFIRLSDARMNLAVVLSTNGFAQANAPLLTFATQLGIQNALPVTTLLEINRLLNNRTIHFDFYGPLTDPRVRLKPLAILREEAAQFLIRELLLTASAASSK